MQKHRGSWRSVCEALRPLFTGFRGGAHDVARRFRDDIECAARPCSSRKPARSAQSLLHVEASPRETSPEATARGLRWSPTARHEASRSSAAKVRTAKQAGLESASRCEPRRQNPLSERRPFESSPRRPSPHQLIRSHRAQPADDAARVSAQIEADPICAAFIRRVRIALHQACTNTTLTMVGSS